MVTTSSRTNSNNSVPLRSQSPSGQFCGSYSRTVASSAFASSTRSTFSSPSSSPFFTNRQENNNIHHRSLSPTPHPMSFRYSLDSKFNSDTNRSISVSKKPQPRGHKISETPRTTRRRCMCSPTTHPGSFRCSLHKNVANPHGQGTASFTTNSLNMRRSAMTNSLVRIGGVEGEWVRRSLTTLIRPSSHHLKRRAEFQPRPSRLSIMSKGDCN